MTKTMHKGIKRRSQYDLSTLPLDPTRILGFSKSVRKEELVSF